ncbi:MAG: hypothetical protein PHR06_06910 [Candidatus Cloacimonetes bacterium]|nr:hypothetical protein [Candidatus Cloacimonadota bacterium]
MRHKRGYRYRRCQTFTGRGKLLPSLITGAISFIFKDLISDKSNIKLAIGRIFGRNREISNNERKVINAEYKILEDDNKNVEKIEKGVK